MRDAYWERRDRVMELLTAADIAFARPEGAFYMWIDISQSRLTDTEFARRMVTDHRVALVPGATFGPGEEAMSASPWLPTPNCCWKASLE